MSTQAWEHGRGQAREEPFAPVQRPAADASDGPACFRPHVAGAPGEALKALLNELRASGLPLAGMTLTRLRAALVFPNGLVAWYCGGWLLWPTGRISARGRPLYTVHTVSDTAGAARRLARLGPAATIVTSHHDREEATAMFVMPPADKDALTRMKALSDELAAAGVANKLHQGRSIDVSRHHRTPRRPGNPARR